MQDTTNVSTISIAALERELAAEEVFGEVAELDELGRRDTAEQSVPRVVEDEEAWFFELEPTRVRERRS